MRKKDSMIYIYFLECLFSMCCRVALKNAPKTKIYAKIRHYFIKCKLDFAKNDLNNKIIVIVLPLLLNRMNL